MINSSAHGVGGAAGQFRLVADPPAYEVCRPGYKGALRLQASLFLDREQADQAKDRLTELLQHDPDSPSVLLLDLDGYPYVAVCGRFHELLMDLWAIVDRELGVGAPCLLPIDFVRTALAFGVGYEPSWEAPAQGRPSGPDSEPPTAA